MTLEGMETLIKEGETYLITGANGFIGSSIALALFEFNQNMDVPCKIILTVRNQEKAVKKYGQVLKSKNVQLVVNDNKEKIIVPGKIDYIISTAAVTKKEIFRNYPADTLNDNIFGIYNCLELAKEKNVKGILFISSVQTYGKLQANMISEDNFGPLDCMKEETVYPESKRIGEMLSFAYYRQFGVPTKCARLFHVYGRGEEYNNGTFLSDFFNDIISDRDIVINGDGNEIRNLCYISDVVRALLFILHKGNCGEAYNVGSEFNNYSIKDWAYLLQKAAAETNHTVNIIIKNQGYSNGKILDKQIPYLEKLKQLGWKEQHVDALLNFKEMINFKRGKQDDSIRIYF